MRKMNVLSPTGRVEESRYVDLNYLPNSGDVVNTSNGESFRVVNVVHDERRKESPTIEVRKRCWVRGVGFEE